MVDQGLNSGKIAVVVVLWYAALLVVGAHLPQAAQASFPIAVAWAAFWTLPGLLIPLLGGWRSGVLGPLAVPLCTAVSIILMAFMLTGLAACRPEARHEFGSVLAVGTFGSVAWAAGWISFRTNRPARLAGLTALAGAALLGFFIFLGDHCDIGQALEYGVVTFVWPLLLLFTFPIALAGALVGALADAARTGLRKRHTSIDEKR
jgi:hypothetical protein